MVGSCGPDNVGTGNQTQIDALQVQHAFPTTEPSPPPHPPPRSVLGSKMPVPPGGQDQLWQSRAVRVAALWPSGLDFCLYYLYVTCHLCLLFPLPAVSGCVGGWGFRRDRAQRLTFPCLGAWLAWLAWGWSESAGSVCQPSLSATLCSAVSLSDLFSGFSWGVSQHLLVFSC